MLFYILKRFLQMVAAIAIVGTIVFIFVNMLGDPAVLLLPPEASPEELAKPGPLWGWINLLGSSTRYSLSTFYMGTWAIPLCSENLR